MILLQLRLHISHNPLFDRLGQPYTLIKRGIYDIQACAQNRSSVAENQCKEQDEDVEAESDSKQQNNINPALNSNTEGSERDCVMPHSLVCFIIQPAFALTISFIFITVTAKSQCC